jgi:hypothetical protein
MSDSSLQRTNTNNSLTLVHSTSLDIFSSPSFPLEQQQIVPTRSPNAVLSFGTKDEAEYFLHYKDELAPWLDVCDGQRHFSTNVTRRITSSPLLLQSIYAWGSLHLSMLRGIDDIVSYTYYNKALAILIPLLNNPDSALSDELLAAIVILRSYEEFSESDEGMHLFGSARLLEHLSTPTTPGTLLTLSSLSKAARWVILRQWIYFGLTKSEPMGMLLDPYIALAECEPTNDENWCNHAVLLFARILGSSFKSQGMTATDWEELQESNEQWYRDKPSTFLPIWEDGNTPESTFPLVWCREDVHLIGLQHYHLSRILLEVFDPRPLKPGFDSFKRQVAANVCITFQREDFMLTILIDCSDYIHEICNRPST